MAEKAVVPLVDERAAHRVLAEREGFATRQREERVPAALDVGPVDGGHEEFDRQVRRHHVDGIVAAEPVSDEREAWDEGKRR